MGRGLKIVSIGGGTGLSTLLLGLKKYVRAASDQELDLPWIESLVAIVTVTDDGGSSGRLREELQMPPPGDIRNCLVALAEDELLLTRLFQHRFESDGSLAGHSFGNLFLAALTDVTGDFLQAIKVTSEVLAIKGRIYPSTVEDVQLVAELEDGRVVSGETNIVQSRSAIRRIWLSPQDCQPLPETLDAIKTADIITLGPGSLFTSVIPNLLVRGISEAIRSSRALRIYICNIMTQPGETAGFAVEDHIRAIYDNSPELELDCVIVNTGLASPKLLEKYLAEGATQVIFKSEPADHLEVALGSGRKARLRLVCGDFIGRGELARHDPHKLARLIVELGSS
jgi:uncharacterized cofD-like protein